MKNFVLLAIGLVVGLGLSKLVQGLAKPSLETNAGSPALVSDRGGNDSRDRRIAELERELASSRQNVNSTDAQQANVPVTAEGQMRKYEAFMEERRLEQKNAETASLLAAGFSQSRIDWLRQRSEELKSQRAQADLERRQRGLPPPDPLMANAYLFEGDLELQAEIGDDEYERYRRALGRPTSVHIVGVHEASNANVGGLRAGDEVVSYGGKRVFSVDQLMSLGMKGKHADIVSVEIIRNGQPMRLAVPGGDLGVKGRPPIRRSAASY